MQIQFPISVSSPSVVFICTKAVTMDEVDMLVREQNQLGQHMVEKKERACDVRLR